MAQTVRANLFFEKSGAEKNQKGVIVVCYAFHNPQNIGAVLRLAGNFNAERVIVCSDDFQLRKRKMRATATTSYDAVDWEIMSVEQTFASIPSDYAIVAIETASQATNILDFTFPEKCAIIMGNERFGLPEEALKRCENVLYIPMPGFVKSMNVSHALSVVLYERFRQTLKG